MTTIRDGRRIAFECEDCSAVTEDFDSSEFDELRASARKDGWKIKPDSSCEGGYAHYCPEHSGLSRVDVQRKLLGL